MKKQARQTTIIVRLILIFTIILINLFATKPAAYAQTNQTPFEDIRSVYTAEFGTPNPAGFAFMPEAKGFLLWAAQPGITLAQLITQYEDAGGSVNLPVSIDNPRNVALNSQSNSLFMLNKGLSELVKINLSQRGLPDPSPSNITRYDVRAFQAQEPNGVTFDPATGRLFILDSKGIVRYSQLIGPIGNIPGNEELLREIAKLKL